MSATARVDALGAGKRPPDVATVVVGRAATRAEDYAVARKQRLCTRNGASYLALELVDPSGRVDARVWNDVDQLE